jgi:hypothetical protein
MNARGGDRFAHEALAELRIAGERGSEDLHRRASSVIDTLAEVHARHAARAERCEEPIPTDDLSDAIEVDDTVGSSSVAVVIIVGAHSNARASG